MCSSMNRNRMKRKDFEAQALPQLQDLYCTALYLLDDVSDAQDAVRESFVRAYRSWHESQYSPDCRVWLFKIMVNVIFNNYLQSSSLSNTTDIADEIDGYLVYSRWLNQQPIEGAGHSPFLSISEDRLREVIGNLPVEFRLTVVLSLLEGFCYREIAEIAGIAVETVRIRLHKGRNLMQSQLFNQAAGGNKYDTAAV